MRSGYRRILAVLAILAVFPSGCDPSKETSPEEVTVINFTLTRISQGASGEPVGSLEIHPEEGRVCWKLGWKANPKAGHLHRIAPHGDDVVAILFEPPNDAKLRGCARAEDPEKLGRVIARPDRFYLDFHNSSSAKPVKVVLGEA